MAPSRLLRPMRQFFSVSLRLAIVIAVAVSTVVAMPTAVAAIPLFVDVSDAVVGYTGNSWGVAWGYFGPDDYPDLYVSNYGEPNKFFCTNLVGVLREWSEPPLNNPYNGTGIAWGDYDNDGRSDLYLANDGQSNKLFKNDWGEPAAPSTIEAPQELYWLDVTNGPLADMGAGRGAAWGDYDNDGDIDLYIANFGTANRLLRNDGNNVFVNVAAGTPLADAGNSTGATWGDYDNDGDLDLYVCNYDSPSKLLRNEGNGVFVNATPELSISSLCTGAAWADYDNDGDLDLYVARYGMPNRLFRNDGNGAFTNVTSGPEGDAGNTRGVAWGDYDNDSDLDLYIANSGQANKLLRNDGNGVFVDVTEDPLGNTGSARGVAWADYNLDGGLDLYLANYGSPNKLLRNQATAGRHWLAVRLRGVQSNRDGIGARVYVEGNGVRQMVEISGGSGFCSQNSIAAHFGLGPGGVSRVFVRWPTGKQQLVFPTPAVDQVITVAEDGTFLAFTDVTAGPLGTPNTMGVTWVDYDNDGALDLFLASRGALLHNAGGGIFEDVTSEPLASTSGRGSAWADYDNDGDLDIYMPASWQTRLFRNEGGGTFVDATPAAMNGVYSYGGAWGDYDKDGNVDLLVFGGIYSNGVKLFRNLGGGSFSEQAFPWPGALLGTAAMDACWGDYDSDGDLDLLAVATSDWVVFRNDGSGAFAMYQFNRLCGPYGDIEGSSCAWKDYNRDGQLDFATTATGVDACLMVYQGFSSMNTGISYGPIAAWGDYDNDRLPDLFDASEYRALWRNLGDGTFADSTRYLAGKGYYGAAWGDYDGDGDLDLYAAGQYPSLFRNELGSDLNWLQVKLIGTISNRAGIGARVWVKSGGAWQMEEVGTGSGFLSQNSLLCEFGLGPASAIDSVKVYWPSGFWQVVSPPPVVNSLITVTESPDFVQTPTALPGTEMGAVAWGDCDNDGDLDLAITGDTSGGPKTRIYRNDGGGVFTDTGAGLPGAYRNSLAWGDFDNDGDLDLLLTGRSPDSSPDLIARVYRNDGGGTFVGIDIDPTLPGLWYSAGAWGDYDNDGDLDLVVMGRDYHNPIARIYRNNGGGSFTDIAAGLPGTYLGTVAWGDYDNDGDLDLLLSGLSTDGTIARVYRNGGGGTFTNIGAWPVGVRYSSAAWGDYNNDGYLDLVLTGWDGAAAHGNLYRNNGNGTFADLPGTGLPGTENGTVAWGDYDNDGWSDLLMTGDRDSSGTWVPMTRVYRNRGDGTFSDIKAVVPGVMYSSAAWGDYDNDGRLDFAMAGTSDNTWTGTWSRIYRNTTGAPANTTPSAPGGLSALVLGDYVVLSWNAAADGQTPPAGLSYNLRIGTTPGGSQVTAAMANAANGYRRVVQLGNGQERTLWWIRLLRQGVHYWSVQAVDGGFAGGPFAPEQSFVSTVGVAEESPAEVSFALLGANPVRDGAIFRFGLPAQTRVLLTIYNVAGRRMTTLAEGELPPGVHTLTWGSGQEAFAPGVYFAHFIADRREFTRRFVVLR